MITVEPIREGWLVKGTRDVDEAVEALWTHERVPDIEPFQATAGRFRKVPGQWSSYVLYEGSGKGTFEAVIFKWTDHHQRTPDDPSWMPKTESP